MLKTLRTSTKWVMITVAICFVGMMVFAWGMDIAGSRGARSGVVGIINGEKITYDAYNTLIEQRRKAMGASQITTLDQERRLHDEVWNELVMNTILQQEIKKRKIFCSDREIVGYMVNNPVSGVEQVPAFRNADGSFNQEAYRGFILNRANLQNPETAQFLAYIESEARKAVPLIKLQELIAGQIIVTEPQVREAWLDKTEQREIEFALVPVSRTAAAHSALDPKDVDAYYKAHREDFKAEEARTLDVVMFPLAATPQDSANVLDRAKLLVERAKKGEDFAGLADGYTEDPGNVDSQGQTKGGDLGYFRKGMMVPAFENVVFGLKPGEIAGPVLTQFGCHIVKLDSVRTLPAEPGGSPVVEVRARHILLKIEPSAATREGVENAVKRFTAAASKKGADFAAAGKAQGYGVFRTPALVKDATVVPYVGANATMLVQRAFRAKKGALLPEYQADGGYFVMRVAEVVPAGVQPLAAVRERVEVAIRREQGVKLAAGIAEGILGRLQPGMSLAQAVGDSSVVEGVRTEMVTRAGVVAGLGAKSPLVAKAFALAAPGQNTGVVKMESGAGIAVFRTAVPLDEARYEAEREQVRQQVLKDIQNRVLGAYVENLRGKAKIVDNRSEMFSM